jgi:hypothetical protein
VVTRCCVVLHRATDARLLRALLPRLKTGSA